MTRPHLPWDNTRCMGRISEASDSAVCEHRTTCLRYQAWAENDMGPRTPVMHWACDMPRAMHIHNDQHKGAA